MSKFTFQHHITYDCNLASDYFYDFKNGHMNDNINLFFGSRQTDYLVIIENEKVAKSSYYKKSQLARMNKASLYELLEKHNHDIIYSCNIEDMTKLDMIDCLLEIDNQEYYTKHYDNECYNNLDFDFATSGYSQGDYCKVKIVGNVEKWINKDYLTNVFYDTPIVGMIEVFAEGSRIDEFGLFEMNNFNEYDYYDKDKLIAIIGEHCKNKDYAQDLLNYLNDNLDNNIEYVY